MILGGPLCCQVDPPPSSPPPLPVNPLLISELAIRLEHKHQMIASFATDAVIDPRPLSLASYALHSGVPESLVRVCLLPEVEREAAGRCVCSAYLFLLTHIASLQLRPG